MTNFTPNFARTEFELAGIMPETCVPAFIMLCHLILEPIRENFRQAMIVTSGWRPPEDNKDVGGSPKSEHIATKDWCAADFKILAYRPDMRPVFDWIRLNPLLPFHEVVLEHGAHGDIIHVSWNRFANLRKAKEGATNNRTPYSSWPVSVMAGARAT